MTCKALFWVDVPCLKELNSFMLISQAVSLQSVGRAVANRLLGGSTETPVPPASGWSSPGELELLIEKPRVPVDFVFPTPRFSLKTKQEVGVICVSYSMAWALVSVRSEMRCVLEHQATADLSQSSLGSQELFAGFEESWIRLRAATRYTNLITFDYPTVWRTWGGQASCLGSHICRRITVLGRKTYNQSWTQFWRKKMSCV